MHGAWAPHIRHVLRHQRPIIFLDRSSVYYWTLMTQQMMIMRDINGLLTNHNQEQSLNV